MLIDNNYRFDEEVGERYRQNEFVGGASDSWTAARIVRFSQ